MDFSKSPFLVIWETTQACDLACQHCRASAQPNRSQRELTTAEGIHLIHQVAEMGTPVIVFSGGDPVKRPDLFDLIREAKKSRLRVGTIPAATALLTRDLVAGLSTAGLDQMAISIDFPRAELHDAFRGVPGAFAKSLQAARWVREQPIALQVNTTITADSLPYLREMGDLMMQLGAVFWEVFFLVPVGRGEKLKSLTAEQCEEAFETLYDVHQDHDFVLKVTEAPHYRRYVSQREGFQGTPGVVPERLRRALGPGGSMGLAPKAVNAGNGFLFVSHEGEIYPSGFLPIRAGNVRTDALASVYRDSELFRNLRSPELLEGRCGVCEFREICGGSRSRAAALAGSPFATDPWCAHRPATDLRHGRSGNTAHI